MCGGVFRFVASVDSCGINTPIMADRSLFLASFGVASFLVFHFNSSTGFLTYVYNFCIVFSLGVSFRAYHVHP